MRILLCVMLVTALSVQAQNREQIWLSAGIKREVAPNLVVGLQTNARIATFGKVQTLFQEASIKSEHLKWFRPSIDYRFITSYAKNGNTTYSHRVNVNLDFRKKIKDFKVGARVRYQIATGGGNTGTDLDPAIRMKPYVEWSIPESRFTPEFSTEFFYNPMYGEFGQRFNRVRFGFGTTIDLPGPNTASFTYYFGKRYNTGNPYYEHLFSLEYSYEWKKAKKK